MTVCYRLNDAINLDINYPKPFIIAHDNVYVKDEKQIVTKKYIVFSSFNEFKKVKDKYPHSYEILCEHKNINDDMKYGRLCFDIDIKEKYDNNNYVQFNFKEQIESVINKVIDVYYKDIDKNKFQFVWSTTKNKNKYSKHLIVKNLCFEKWIDMTKLFYKQFEKIWNEKYKYIKASDFVDNCIARKHTLMRMVGCSKIGKNKLKLDEPEKYNFNDTLIRMYNSKDLQKEQIINNSKLINNVCDDESSDYEELNGENIIKIKKNNKKLYETKCEYDNNIYKKAFELVNSFEKDVFIIRNINGQQIYLNRLKKAKCLLSEKIHENENAFISINLQNNEYNVYFNCRRNCSKKNSIIGYIKYDNYKNEYVFEQLTKMQIGI